MTYEQYIGSSGWSKLRAQAIERDGNRCRLCDTTDGLQVHHRRYPPRGQWHLDCLDALTTLCSECHDIITNKQREQRYAGLAAPIVSNLPDRPTTQHQGMANELPRIGLQDHGGRAFDPPQWPDSRPSKLPLQEHRRDHW